MGYTVRGFQPAEMPATPLARGMRKYEGLRAIESHGSAPVFHSSGPAQCSSPAPSTFVKTPGGGAPATVAPPCLRGAAPDIAIARYESRDAQSGRTWGMPSAFGRGQCLDCPKKAAPPSLRCHSCQRALALAVHEPMAPDALTCFRTSLGPLLEEAAKRGKCEELARRVDHLCSQLAAGQVAPPIQAKLARVSEAIRANDRAAAGRELAAISAEHWEQHKDWIVAMRRLVLAH